MGWQGKPHTPTAPRELPPQSIAIDLFSGEAPAVKRDGSESGLTIQQRFDLFHRHNGWVYEALEKLAADLIARGRTRIGVKALVEIVRWQWQRATSDPTSDLKLNNTLTSRYARLLLERHPEWSDHIETRRLSAA